MIRQHTTAKVFEDNSPVIWMKTNQIVKIAYPVHL